MPYWVMGMSEDPSSRLARIGLDDTDHPEVGCTTERMDDLIRTIRYELDVVVVERRLVRLWPFAERRTRGNGALGVVIDLMGECHEALLTICRGWFEVLISEIEKYPPTKYAPSPCMVISSESTPEEWYWSAVRSHVDAPSRLGEATDHGCIVLSSKTPWGVVGASAAISWVPNPTSSWELIAWRDPALVGSRRGVDHRAICELEEAHPETFVNRDPTKGRGLIAPRTPCPVLYGIRGATSQAVTQAHEWLQSRGGVERCSGHAAHRTNQLSDDHIESTMNGTIVSGPKETKGGHSHLVVFSGSRPVTLMAFSEGGPVNRLLRQLVPGDIVSWTGLASPNGSIHLEKLCLDSPTPRIIRRPVCCSNTMRSAGRYQDLRCRTCGRMQKKAWASHQPSSIHLPKPGAWAEPTASNRRHLARPISLGPIH
jgi:tRNA(Ile2)-agmatinylcytidine synthase